MTGILSVCLGFYIIISMIMGTGFIIMGVAIYLSNRRVG